MTQPTPQQIEAAIDAMHVEAAIWNDIHERLNRCATHVRSLPIDPHLESALFGSLLTAHNDVAERFAVRCTEGSVQTFAMGLALASVADGYAAAEEANLHRLGRLFESGDR